MGVTKLIEEAKKRGWADYWAEDKTEADLLFGKDLGFLRALVGTGHCCHVCGTIDADHHSSVCSAIGLSYPNRTYWLATRLVVMPDEKRIPWLFNHLFKETLK